MPDGPFSLRRGAADLAGRPTSLLLGGSLALALVTPKGFGLLLALLVVVSLFSITPGQLTKLRAQDRVFLTLINVYPLLVATSMLVHGLGDASHFDNPARFLLLSIVYTALRAKPFSMSFVVGGAMVGCCLAFGASLLHLLQDTQVMPGSRGRYVGSENAVVFAQIAFFLLLVAITPIRLPILSGAPYRLLLLAVVLMASTSLLVSQSRWVLLALLGIYVYLIIFDRRLPGARLARLPWLLMPVCAAVFFLSTPYVHHLAGTPAEVAANLAQIDQSTSLGQRLALWSSSWDLIRERPLWGHGIGQFRQALNSLPEAVSLSDTVRGYGHAHNEFLQIAVEQGLPGLGLFLFALSGILLTALREGFAADARHLLLGSGLAWLFFGLTHTQLAHQQTTTMFVLLLALGFSHGMNVRYGALNANDAQG